MIKNFADAFQTPPNVCDYMVSLVPKEAQTILEPTQGKGNIVRSLRSAGYKNITTPKNVFVMREKKFDCIVMNPPFSEKYANMEGASPDLMGLGVGVSILRKCSGMSNNIIALMPWFTLIDSDVRTRAFKKFGLRSVTALPRKTFKYSRIQTMVMEFEQGYAGATEFKVFDLL